LLLFWQPQRGKDMTCTELFIGTAGWSVPRIISGAGTHLQRYANRLNATEINSSFYRPHRFATYARWADATPKKFRFSVKVPKTISHENRLVDSEKFLSEFANQVAGLREKLGVVLLQLPPKLAFDPYVVETFLENHNKVLAVPLVIEPRHASWFDGWVDQWLSERRIARAAADPAIVRDAGSTGGWRGLSYYRWHGSPRMYYSRYDAVALERVRQQVDRADGPAWCIFDNTAAGAAFENALGLASAVSARALLAGLA
jgi:uncharacterized protein YecE (DUF72 family)